MTANQRSPQPGIATTPRSPLGFGVWDLGFFTLLLGILTVSATTPTAHAATPSITLTNTDRVVLLGDSITDGDTYRQFMRDALDAKGLDGALLFNAGVGGDTAPMQLARFERDVLVHEPTIITISVGVNDAARDVTMQQYTSSVTAMLDMAKAADARVVLVTPTPIGPKSKQSDERRQQCDAFAQWMRDTAAKRDLVLADAHARFAKAMAAGEPVMEGDDIHPNLAGQQLLARVLLDALGQEDAEVPDTLRHRALPGLIRNWQIWPAVEDAPLSMNAIQNMDAEPMPLELPQHQGGKHWWIEFGRAMGMATDVHDLTGENRNWAHTTWQEAKPRQAWLNLGGWINELRINGQSIEIHKASGWHPGKQRVPVQLKVGQNEILLEAGTDFFVSLTESPDWQ